MSLVALAGTPFVPIGPGTILGGVVPGNNAVLMDAANEATILIGQICTSDGGSHTINTTGSSSIGWRTSAVTFANAGTTLKVGIAAVDTSAGPPARAANVADVITFDVSKSLTGGAGGVTVNSWHTHVPDAGTKTIAHGALVAVCMQMTARAGVDVINAAYGLSATTLHRPLVTQFTGGSYAAVSGIPSVMITFSDGALGYFYASDVFSTINTRIWNSGSATKEYGQLFSVGFPMSIYGIYGWADIDADLDIVLYSDPLGTPVAQQTVSIDANTVTATLMKRFSVAFDSPYRVTANQEIGAVFKPGASNVTATYRTLASAAHRVADVWGASGYGISRASGAFTNANSSLDHYYIGLIAGAFEHGVPPTYALGI